MKNYLVFFMLLFFVGYSAFAQTLASFDKWIDYPVSSTYLKKAISAETYDGTNTWVAIQIDTSASKKYQQLLRLDTDGNPLFAKQHYTRGYIYNIKATPDDGCLLIGVTAQGSYWVGWVAKCDKFGEIQWSYAYGEPNIHIYFEQAVLAKNGNYVVAGWCYLSGSKYGIVAMEIDTLGNMQWVGKYDDDNSILTRRMLSRILVLDDGSYVIGTYYTDAPCYSRLIRLKKNGELWYHNTYYLPYSAGCPFSWLEMHEILPIKNDLQKPFYIFLGKSSMSPHIIKTDSAGNKLFSHPIPIYYDELKVIYANPNYTKMLFAPKEMYPYSYVVSLDSAFNSKVYYYDKQKYDTHADLYQNISQLIMAYNDNLNKKIILRKRNLDDFDGVRFCRDTIISSLTSSLNFRDTIVYIATSKPTYTRQFLSYSSQNISLTIHTECSKATSIQDNLFNSTPQGVFVYPNPANTHLYIKLPEQNTDIRIWDMYGKLVYERKNVNTLHQVSVEHFSQGLYNVEIQTNQQKQFQKFLKID